VYGKTFDEKRIKFDIFDDINNKIAKKTKLTICSGFICTIKEYSELLFNKQ
jgi:hypothetical protein